MHLTKKIFKKEYLANILELDLNNLNSSPLRHYYKYIIKNCSKIDGDIIELGVLRGKSLLTIAVILKKLKIKKRIIGFDTFSGFPKLHKLDSIDNFKNRKYFTKDHYLNVKDFWKLKNKIYKKKLNTKNISSSLNFSNSSISLLKEKIKLLKLKNVTIIKGDVIETLPRFLEKNSKLKIMACNLDIDLYFAYKKSLPILWPRLEKNGYIHLDEYYSLKFPGPKIACDDFIDKNNIKLNFNNSRPGEFKRCFLKK